VNEKNDFLHVTVGVIKNTQGQMLISQRANHVHQAGLWEFPGGKVEAGESVRDALKRELQEELGITVIDTNPLIKVRHHYADLSVLLDVWTVESFSGVAHGRENQIIQWVNYLDLNYYAFPAANEAIIRAAQLPRYYAILDDGDAQPLINKLLILLNNNVKLIQARLKNSSETAVAEFMAAAMPLCKDYHASLLLNSAVKNARQYACDGVHFTSADLMALHARPAVSGWLAASCHNLAQLQQAERLGFDFAVLAPVLATPTHPDAQSLGWDVFAALVSQVNLPVYALGGVSVADKETAWHCGGQGIAGIRAFFAQAV
jgi:8-oxo-dGTP diphosphatase